MSLTSEKKEFFLAEKTKECESQSQTIKELQEQLKEKGDAVDQLSHEKESLRKSIDEKEKRIQELQAQMQDVDLSKMKEEKESLLKDVSTSNALIADLNKKNEELCNTISNLNQEIEKQSHLAKAQESSLSLTEQQVRSLSDELASANQHSQALEATIAAMNGEKEEKEKEWKDTLSKQAETIRELEGKRAVK